MADLSIISIHIQISLLLKEKVHATSFQQKYFSFVFYV